MHEIAESGCSQKTQNAAYTDMHVPYNKYHISICGIVFSGTYNRQTWVHETGSDEIDVGHDALNPNRIGLMVLLLGAVSYQRQSTYNRCRLPGQSPRLRRQNARQRHSNSS